MSTLIFFTIFILFCSRTKRNGNDPNNPLLKDLLQTAVAFWDTLTWFGVLATLAGAFYVWSSGTASTHFELIVSFFVQLIIFNSGIALCGLSALTHIDESVQQYSRIIPQCLIYLVACVGNGILLGDAAPSATYSDLDYNVWGTTSVDLLQTVAKVEMPLLILFNLLGWTALAIRRYRASKEYPILLQWLYFILATYAIIMAWLAFSGVIAVRISAYNVYLDSPDMSAPWGYGQIISAGVAFQAVWSTTFTLFGIKHTLLLLDRADPSFRALASSQILPPPCSPSQYHATTSRRVA